MNRTYTKSLFKSDGILTAPIPYWKSIRFNQNQFNGCGGNDITSFIVPDSLLGLDITSACNIHDYMYSNSSLKITREKADRIFLDNMLSLVEKKSSSKIIKCFRRIKSYLYYYSVRLFGKTYFAKNSPATDF